MKRRTTLIFIIVLTISLSVYLVYNSDSAILAQTVYWTEIVIVLSFFAGFFKFLTKECFSLFNSFKQIKNSFKAKNPSSLIKEIKSNVLTQENEKKSRLPNIKATVKIEDKRTFHMDKLLNSFVIIVSAVGTFIVGFINPNQSRYTFENIVREQPEFLTQTALVLVENHPYLSKFPSKKKLALYIAADVSTEFFPTEDMLKQANLSLKNYKKLLNENKVPNILHPSDNSGITFINENEMKLEKEIKEQVKSVSVDIIDDMFPIAQDLKEWFNQSVSSLKYYELQFGEETVQGNRFEDFKYGGISVPGSGYELENWINSEKKQLGKNQSVKLNKDAFRYNVFLSSSKISENVAENLANIGKSTLPLESKKRIAAKFIETGITTSSEITGLVRWIYRYIFDPLFSSFAALLLLNMIFTVFTKFSLQKYSYAVITLAFCATLIGLTNQYALFAQNNLSDWNGPFAPGWLMTSVSATVFKALAIATASGLLFFLAENIYSAFYSVFRREK